MMNTEKMASRRESEENHERWRARSACLHVACKERQQDARL